jgi:UPF0755 protein
MSGKKRNKKLVVAAVAVVLIGVALVFGWTPAMIYLKKTSNDKETRVVIDNRKSLEEIAVDLEKAGVITDKSGFLSMAASKKLTVENIEPGMYAFPAHTSFRDLLNSLKSGSFEVEVVVTFNNCKTIHDLAAKVSQQIMVDSSELESYITSQETLNKYGFTLEQVPALFMPNSYRMYYDTGKEAFLERMAKEFKNFWTPARMAKLKEVGLKSPSQAVTLASIVYGEQSKNASEWPIIARLYLNRLNTGMKLQSDPTFKFCWGDQLEGVQRLTYEHRNKDCPYNTYLYAGLPPGPISMPPTGVVEAVLNPDKNDYLYMCAQPNYDGLHNFAKDYADHAKYAAEFQKWLASEIANN